MALHCNVGEIGEMPEREGYLSQGEIERETGESYFRVRIAIASLNIKPTTFPEDRRKNYYTLEQVEQIKQWLREHVR